MRKKYLESLARALSAVRPPQSARLEYQQWYIIVRELADWCAANSKPGHTGEGFQRAKWLDLAHGRISASVMPIHQQHGMMLKIMDECRYAAGTDTSKRLNRI